MSFKGDLSTIGLAEVFQMISMGQKEGTLVVHDTESKKAIYFGKEGVQLLSSGKRKGIRLGDILVRAGKITVDQLRDVLQKQKESKRRLGEELIESGLVAQKDIDDVVRSQVEEEIYDLFLWKKAAFEFIEGPPVDELTDPDNKATRLAFDINSLLLEAVRRTDEWTLINQKIPSMDCIYEWSGESARPEEERTAGDLAKSVISVIDGQSTVNDVIEASLAPRFDVCKIFIDLLDRGRVKLLSVQDMAAVAKRRLEEGRRDKGYRLFQVATMLAPEDADLLGNFAHAIETEGMIKDAARMYVKVGNILKAQGQKKDAIAYFQRAISLDPDDAQSKVALFEVQIAGGNIEEAIQSANEVVISALKDHDFETARTVSEQAVEAAPQNADLRLLLARVYHAVGEKARRNEVVSYLRKNLPVDPVAAQRIVAELREMEDGTRETSSQPSPVRSARRSAKKKSPRAMIAIVAVLLLGGGFFVFDYQAKGALEACRLDAEAAVAQKDYETARAKISAFEAGIWGKHPLLKGAIGEARASVESKITEHIAATTPKEDPEKLRRAEMERASQALEALGEEMDQAIRGGQYEKGVDSAARLKKLTGEWAHPEKKERMKDLGERASGVLLSTGKYLDDAKRAYDETVELEKRGKFKEAAEKIHTLKTYSGMAEVARQSTYPLLIRVRPEGTQIRRGSEVITVRNGEALIRLATKDPFTLLFSKPGFFEKTIDVNDPRRGELDVVLDLKKERWSRGGLRITAPPQVSGRHVLLACDQTVYSVTGDGSSIAFSSRLDVNVTLPFRLGKGVLAIPAGRRLVALDPDPAASTRMKSAFVADLPITTGPAFDAEGETAYFAAGETIYAVVLRGTTAELLWKHSLPRSVTGDPVVHQNTVIVPCSDGTLYALRAVGGGKAEAAWKVVAGGPLLSAPHLAGPWLHVASNERPGRVYRVNVEEGIEVWKMEAGDGQRSPALERNFLVVTKDSGLFGYDTGEAPGAFLQRWQFRLGGSNDFTTAPVLSGGHVLAGNKDGHLYCVDGVSGQLLWKFSTGKAIHFPPAVAEGTVYFGSEDKKFYAVGLNGE